MVVKRRETGEFFNKKAQSIMSVLAVIILIFGGIIAFDMLNRESLSKSQLQNIVTNITGKMNDLQIKLGDTTLKPEQLMQVKSELTSLEEKRISYLNKINQSEKPSKIPAWLSGFGFTSAAGYEGFSFSSLTNLINILAVILASLFSALIWWLLITPDPFSTFGRGMKRHAIKYIAILLGIGICMAIAFAIGEKFPKIASITLLAAAIIAIGLFVYFFIIPNKDIRNKWLWFLGIIGGLYLVFAFGATMLRIILLPLFSDYGLKLAVSYESLVKPIAESLGREVVDYSAYSSMLWEYIKLVLLKAVFTAIEVGIILVIIKTPKFLKDRIEAISNAKKEEQAKYEEQQGLIGAETLKKVGREAANV